MAGALGLFAALAAVWLVLAGADAAGLAGAAAAAGVVTACAWRLGALPRPGLLRGAPGVAGAVSAEFGAALRRALRLAFIALGGERLTDPALVRRRIAVETDAGRAAFAGAACASGLLLVDFEGASALVHVADERVDSAEALDGLDRRVFKAVEGAPE